MYQRNGRIYNHLNMSSSVLVLAMVVTFRIPQITHHSAVLFRTVRSAFYFPQFRILPTPADGHWATAKTTFTHGD